MKKLLLETSFSKIYILTIILISILIVGGYFSYAMFTITNQKNNAISIVTGNLTYKLEVDGKESNTLTIENGTTKQYTVTLSNPNNRTARFNFYYEGNLPENVEAGYITGEGLNTPPNLEGINLSQNGASGSSNIYSIRVSNKSSSSVTITLGVSVGLDYNDLTLPENGHLFEEVSNLVGDLVIDNLSNGSTYDDGIDTFITGEDPNNYIWYSGKLWRAVSVNNEAKTTKLVTQWNISTINYSNGSTAFEGSYMEEWLNDTTVDGFLGNLREPDKFIVTDAKWDATEESRKVGSVERPNGTTLVTDTVGLLNIYEYQSSSGNNASNYTKSYLNNSLYWYTLTPFDLYDSGIVSISDKGEDFSVNPSNMLIGVRPSINLKSNIQITSGDGTIDNPYRLEGDNDTNLSDTLLSSRYSGEYIKFGTGENNIYRIVSHETSGLTKIVSATPLKDSEIFKEIIFGNDEIFSTTNTIGTFLNSEYLTNYVNNNYVNMIEDNTTWYIGQVDKTSSYKLTKYKDETMQEYAPNTTAKVGLLRFGELMAGQFDTNDNNMSYWSLTSDNSSSIYVINNYGVSAVINPSTFLYGINLSFNLKSNVVITGGDGTKNNPFNLELQ